MKTTNAETIKKLLDELPVLWEVSKDLQSPIYGAIIRLKIAELQKVLEEFLTIELETE